jgi:hypothetical protein
VDDQTQRRLGAEITPAQIALAIKHCARGKSPGSSGVITECYQMVMAEVSAVLARQFNNARARGQLSELQRHGVMALVYKAGDRRSVKNWRPLTLLNRDYSILSTILVCIMRTRDIMRSLLDPSQTGFVKHREI